MSVSGSHDLVWVAIAAVAVACAAAGCVDPDADGGQVVETELLRISTTADRPICAGTPIWLDSELGRIGEALSLPLWGSDSKLDVHFGDDAVEALCSNIGLDQSLGGCVGTLEGETFVAVRNVSSVVSHELVHAVRNRNEAWAEIPFEEGVAEILSGSDGLPFIARYPRGAAYTGPMDLLEIPREEFGGELYIPSASFVSWMWEIFGQGELMGFLDDPQIGEFDVATVFAEHFGMTLGEAEQAWRDYDGDDLSWGRACVPARTHAMEGGVIEIEGDLDCARADILGASAFMKPLPMCIEIPRTMRVRISFEADHGDVSMNAVESCDTSGASSEAVRSKYLSAGEVLEEEIIGCVHRVFLVSQEEGVPATSYVIRVEELG